LGRVSGLRVNSAPDSAVGSMAPVGMTDDG
jgi:hypothetical protein